MPSPRVHYHSMWLALAVLAVVYHAIYENEELRKCMYFSVGSGHAIKSESFHLLVIP